MPETRGESEHSRTSRQKAKASLPVPEGKATSSARKLTPQEATLVNEALGQAKRVPKTADDMKAVQRFIAIRKRLREALVQRFDPLTLARRALKRGLVISLTAQTLIPLILLWRALERYTAPIPGVEDPVYFLLGITLLFLLGWLPLVMGYVRRRSLLAQKRRHGGYDPAAALLVYDTALVRWLIR